ncbi:hypothetical protein V8G54_008643 [Vigna mungo]|uniref:Uncharacterized protein n=1 Tax=Vigna mungo TaxID=3915 RepID=A0AAQ3P5J7_VIGMU
MHMLNIARLNYQVHLYVVHNMVEPQIVEMLDWVCGEVDDEGHVETQVEGEGDAHQGDEDGDVQTDLLTKNVDGHGDEQEVHGEGEGAEEEGDEDNELHGEGDGDGQECHDEEVDAQEGDPEEGHGVDAEVHHDQPEVHEVDHFEVEDLGMDDEEEDSE